MSNKNTIELSGYIREDCIIQYKNGKKTTERAKRNNKRANN